MKSKTRILAPTSPTIPSSRSLRETSLMRSRRRLGGGWPGSRQWLSPPTVKTSLIPTDGEGGLHLAVETSLIRSKPTVIFTHRVDNHREKNGKGEKTKMTMEMGELWRKSANKHEEVGKQR
ncbi:hypothetical protein AAG906_017910 [Vitis piasezkii]